MSQDQSTVAFATALRTAPGPKTRLRNGLVEIDLKPGQAIPKEQVVRAVLVTPQLAADWLARYTDPKKRRLRQWKIADYTRKMQDGSWLEMSKSMEFTNGGDPMVSDGHHRLHAVIASGKSLWFIVHFGADIRARRIEGTRLARTAADALTMEGCPAYTVEIGAGTRGALLYEQTHGTDTRWRKGLLVFPDNEDIVETYLKNSAVWDTVAAEAKTRAMSWPRDTSQQAMTTFLFLAEMAHSTDGIAFLNDVANGGGPVDGRGLTVMALFSKMSRKAQAAVHHRSGTQLEWYRWTLTVMIRAFNARNGGTWARPEWGGIKPFVLDKVR